MKGTVFTIFIISFIVSISNPAVTEASKAIDRPKQIEISGTIGKGTFQRTFEITALSNIENFSLSATDLREKGGDDWIGSGSIEIQPAKVASFNQGDSASFTINVKNLTTTGEYRGQIKIRYDEKVAQTDRLPIVVTVKAKTRIFLSAPSKILIKTQRSSTPIQRFFTLQEQDKQSSVKGVTIIRQDLITEDQAATINQNIFQTELDRPEIPKGSYATGTLTLQKLQYVQAGKYSGKLIVQSSNADDLNIPVEILVKDPIYCPLVVLIIGFLLGLLLNWWDTKGKKQVELEDRIREVQLALNDDVTLNQIFGGKIQEFLKAASEKLNRNDLSGAEGDVKSAEQKVDDWRYKSTDFLQRIEDIKKTISEKIDQRKEEFRRHDYVISIQEMLEEILNRIGGYPSLAVLDEEIKKQKERLEKFDDLIKDLRSLEQDFSKEYTQPDDKAKQIEAQIKIAKQQLKDARVEQEVQQVRETIDNARKAFDNAQLHAILSSVPEKKKFEVLTTLETKDISRISTLFQSLELSPKVLNYIKSIAQRRTAIALPSVPFQIPQVSAVKARKGMRDLRRCAKFAIPVILAGVAAYYGLATIYGANDTFGATKWYGDYLGLFGWGFGLELTRSKLTEIIKTARK